MMLRIVLAVLLAMSLSGCVVMKSTHDEALAKIQNLETDLTRKDQELQAISDKLDAAVKERGDAVARAKEVEGILQARMAEIEKFKKDADDIGKKSESIESEIKEVQTHADTIRNKIKDLQKITAAYRQQEGSAQASR